MTIFSAILLMLLQAAQAPTPATATPTRPPGQRQTPCAASLFRQFDFWVGRWDVVNAAGQFAGTENWNGRLAMIGFVSALFIEVFSQQGVLHFWGLM